MTQKRALSLTGKVGDVTSGTEVAEATEGASRASPAEADLAAALRTPSRSTMREFLSLIRAAAQGPHAKRMYVLGGALAIAMVFSVIGEIRMNQWQGDFYRAIEHRSLADVGHEAWRFILIMGVLLSLVVSQNWFNERLKLRIREGLTHRLLDGWLAPGRAYRLNLTSEEEMNPDQRIQEDVRNFSEATADLGYGMARATAMLVSFVGVLWGMSSGISFEIFGRTWAIPGYMVWFAVGYAALGTGLAAKVGAPLIKINDKRYATEANLRYSLVRVSESAESVAFYSGERDERKLIENALGEVLKIMRKLSFANARLTTITSGHGWMVVILPVLVALPGYMQGKFDFGSLMMIVGAFNQVQASLRWFVENFGRIAEWSAATHRVAAFRDGLETVDEYEDQPDTIELVDGSEDALEFDNVKVSLMRGDMVIANATAVIKPGERVLVVGESGSGKSTLFRAVAGLWPWGAGRIKLPPRDQMMFLPQRPYMPLGTLAAALAYPRSAQDWDRGKMEDALRRVNLEEFVDRLDEDERWDKAMSLGQQQRLAFARLVLHRPRWIFLDEATSALDDENQDLMMRILIEDLGESAVMSIGHRSGLDQYHTRELHLKQTNEGRVLTRKARVAAMPVPTKAANLRARVRSRLHSTLRGKGVSSWLFGPHTRRSPSMPGRRIDGATEPVLARKP